MLTNPGFSFVGLSGHHKIIPTVETDLPVWGPIYAKTVKCVEIGQPVTVYGKASSLDSFLESPALEFAGLDCHDESAILSFCDKYGLPGSQRQEANFRNSYIYSGISKDQFAECVEFERTHEVEWLGSIQRSITGLRLLMDLNEAIQKEDFYRILEIMTFFCFDLSGLDFEGSCYRSETFKFNHAFFRFAEACGYSKAMGIGDLELSELISYFFNEIEWQFTLEYSYNQAGHGYPNPYNEYRYSQTWQHLVVIFKWLLERTTIESVGPFGEVSFGANLRDIDISPLITEGDHFISAAKAMLADLFKERLEHIAPEIQFNNGSMPEANWRIPSLLDAMYLDAFFRLTPTTTVRRCANPTCSHYFTWSKSRKTRIYCSASCAELMAKRKQREREKAKKVENKSEEVD